MAQLAKGQWTEEQAWDWYDRQGWIRGWCGYPSNCTGRVAMWQEYGHAEVAQQIEREFALAQSIGYNAVRAIIQFEVWRFEHDSFMKNLEEYLTLADRYGIRVMLCLGNDCTVPKSVFTPVVFGEQKVDWGYHSGIKRGPHAGGYNEPGYMLLDDSAYENDYYDMVSELADVYGQDRRIQIWDVWNEIGASRRGNLSLKAMETFFEILRSKKVSQPLTADGWNHFEGNEIEKRAMDLSDVITFHSYKEYSVMVELIARLKKLYRRPLINNEWLNRSVNNRVQEIFPLFWLEKVGSYNWGLMQGYSQTYEPWGGYFAREDFLNGKLDLRGWQHDLFRFNGLPYDPNEISIIRHFCALADTSRLK